MKSERLEDIAKRIDKLRQCFIDVGAFALAADMRDVYMVLLDEIDKRKKEPCPECGTRKE